jgi:hypothetical protein
MQLPKITISGQTYTTAISLKDTVQFLKENFQNEAFSISELVSDLEDYQAIQTVIKLDNSNNTYCLTFSGSKDEFSLINGRLLTLDMITNEGIYYTLKGIIKDLKGSGISYWSSGLDWFLGKEPETVFDK